MLSIAVIKEKKNHRQCGKERIYFSFVSITEGSQDRSSGWELEAGTEAEIGKEQDSLIRCPRFAQPAVLYTQDHLPGGGTAHGGGWHCPRWDGPSHVHYELRKGLPGLPTGQPGRSILSKQVPRRPGRRQVDKKLTNKTGIYNFNVAKSINSSFIAAITFYILFKSVSLL